MYRTTDASAEACGRCGGLSSGGCGRCRRPYCDAHQPGEGRRCDPCEAEYLARETAVVRRVVVSALIMAGITALVGVFATHAARNGFLHGPHAHLAPLILFAALAAIVVIFTAPPLLRRRLRRQFLRDVVGGRRNISA